MRKAKEVIPSAAKMNLAGESETLKEDMATNSPDVNVAMAKKRCMNERLLLKIPIPAMAIP